MRTITTATAVLIVATLANASAGEKVFRLVRSRLRLASQGKPSLDCNSSGSNAQLNLMDKIIAINLNIGKSIPVNTIPDEFRSGNEPVSAPTYLPSSETILDELQSDEEAESQTSDSSRDAAGDRLPEEGSANRE